MGPFASSMNMIPRDVNRMEPDRIHWELDPDPDPTKNLYVAFGSNISIPLGIGIVCNQTNGWPIEIDFENLKSKYYLLGDLGI